jgi:hypothetical protein
MKELFDFLINEMHFDEDTAQAIIDNDEYTCYGTLEQYGRFLFENEIEPDLDNYWASSLTKSVDFEKLAMADINDINRFIINGEVYEIDNY